jgi:hypothetical protein
VWGGGVDKQRTHAAVAHDGRGDATVRRGCEERIPGRLRVIVGMHVDPSGGHKQTPRINLSHRAAAAQV